MLYPFNPYACDALNSILTSLLWTTSVNKMQKQARLGNFLVLWESWRRAICVLNDNCSPSVSVKADILTSSSEVDCFTSCGFPGHTQFFWYHALDILHISCCWGVIFPTVAFTVIFGGRPRWYFISAEIFSTLFMKPQKHSTDLMTRLSQAFNEFSFTPIFNFYDLVCPLPTHWTGLWGFFLLVCTEPLCFWVIIFIASNDSWIFVRDVVSHGRKSSFSISVCFSSPWWSRCKLLPEAP